MAPFRRGRSAAAPSQPLHDEEDDDESEAFGASPNVKSSAWEARHRRRNGTTSGTTSGKQQQQQQQRSRSSKKKKKQIPDGEYDPYDSDPGESYRQHVERMRGEGTRSCLAMPRFLKEMNNNGITTAAGSSSGGGKAVNLFGSKGASVGPNRRISSSSRDNNPNDISRGEISTQATSPPSPLTSEQDDPFNSSGMSPSLISKKEQYYAHHYPNGMPASLPRDLARVRYSLRTSIGDGTDPQPALQSSHLMERRELRPNNVHINVSHWSDFGGRNYMEDRYVI